MEQRLDDQKTGKPTKANGRPTADATDPDEDLLQWIRIAEMGVNPILAGASVVEAFAKGPSAKVTFPAVTAALASYFRDVEQGDTRRLRAMLLSQALSLQSIYTHLACRSLGADGLPHFRPEFLMMALKAQSASRMCVEALDAMLHPGPTMVVSQTTLTHQHVGQQPGQQGDGRTGNSADELLSAAIYATLDNGSAKATSSIDPNLAAMGTFNRAKKPRREDAKLPEQLQARRTILRLAGDGQAAGGCAEGMPGIRTKMPGPQPGGLKVSGDEAERLDRMIAGLPAPKI